MLNRTLIAAAVLALASCQPAAAQSRNCAPRSVVVEKLAENYSETRQSVGLSASGAMVEVFASDETGSWTIIVTQPNGVACLVASGQSYERVDEDLPVDTDPT